MEDLNKIVMSCISTVILLCRLQQYLGLQQTFSTKMSSHLHGDKPECITWTTPSDKVPEDQEVALSSLCLSSSLSEGQKLASCSVAALPFESSNSSALACEQEAQIFLQAMYMTAKYFALFLPCLSILCFPNPTSSLALWLCCKMNSSWMTLIVSSTNLRVSQFFYTI